MLGALVQCVCVSAEITLQQCEISPRSEGNKIKTVQDDSIVSSRIKELHLSSISIGTWLQDNVSWHVTVLQPVNIFRVLLFEKINPTQTYSG